MKVRITFTEPVLGTASSNPDVHEEFIASKSADKDKVKEEMKALHADELMDKAVTVFPKDEDGCPIMWDYQVKGFFKETLGILLDYLEPDCKIGKAKLSKWTYKKVVDNAVFVRPRKVRLEIPEGTSITLCTRPLRADTMRGERVALATSEEVPEGTTIVFSVETLDKKLDDLIRKCLDFGENKGIGQWRNSGKGRFTWEEID